MSEELKPRAIVLEEPVTHNDKTYKEITFSRKMKGKDMLAGDAVQGNTRKEFAVISSMANVPLPVILELNVDDLEAVLEAAVPFMGKRAAEAVRLRREKGADDLLT